MRRMGMTKNGWQSLTVSQQLAAVITVIVLVFEVITVVVEAHAIERRVVERARTTTVDFAASVLPLLTARTGEDRAQIAAELESGQRRVILGTPPGSMPGPMPGSMHRVTDTTHLLNAQEALAENGIATADLVLSERTFRGPDGQSLRDVVLSILPEGEQGWLSVQTRSLDAQIRRPLLITAALESLVAIFVLGLVLIVVARILGPLGGLARNAELLAHGERPDEIPNRGGGRDMRTAIRSFNQMSKILAQTMDYQRGLLMSLGHDLKSPLNHAREQVAKRVEEPSMEGVLRSLDRAQSVLSLVTEYTRATMRDGALEVVEVGSLLQALAEEAQDRGQDVEGAPDCQATIQGHYNALTRALRNLIENAAKYGGSARIDLTRDNGFATIDIEDDGPGIEEGMLEEVLLPFRRLSDDASGTGLGLAIAKTIIVDNGGTLTLFNRPGGGLTARAVFPLYVSGGSGRNA